MSYSPERRSEDWPEDSKNGPSKDQGNYDGPPGMEPQGALDTNWHQVVESFDDMNLKEELLRGIYAYGFEKPSAIQQRAIMPCIQGRDVIAQAQSGTGKTATFSISILQQIDTSIRECQALILAPTRELAQQIQKVVIALGDHLNAKCHACIGGTNVREDVRQLESGVHVVVGTPGRVYDMITRRALRANTIKLFVLDEADEMLSRGFKDQIHDVFKMLSADVQVILLSATMPDDVLEVSRCFMRDPVRILVQKEEVLKHCFLLSSLIHFSNGFYVPGVAPVEFKKGQRIEVKAVKMTSIHTQLPYEYYSLPLCLPKNGTFVYKSENLGEVLRGDRIVNTPYEVHMAENIKCRLLCHHKNNPINWSVEESEKVASRIEHEYFVHLLVDNLPVATRITNSDTSERSIEQGYRLGFMSKGKAYINNHLKLLLKYHKHSQDSYRVVGFEVETVSVDKDDLIFVDDSCQFPNDPSPQLVNEDTGTKLYFTYSVEWGESDISWASRWDIYLGMKDVQIHWFSIVNSIVVLFFLSGILTMIMVRTLRRDIARYNSDESIDDMMEETGWKLVHGDVFRPPPKRMLFAAVIGSGIQVFLMALITIFIAMLGMLSPASRGALMTAAIFLYVFMGLIAGYYSARLYNTMKGKQWKQAAFLTATLYPAIVFGTCFFLNFFIMGKHSSGAVPFSTMMALLCLWFCISLPLVYLGYYFGCRKQPFQHPVRTNFIPRKVPEQVWYMNIFICILMAGILPFGAVFIELFFIFNALWENQFYYLFGFLFLVFCILVVSVSQISIVMVYFQLCGEDYHWWWKSFIVSGGSAVYILIYSIFYFFTKLEITEFIPTLLYIGYTGLMVLTFWLLTGTIGFFAAYTFIRKIYAAVKID